MSGNKILTHTDVIKLHERSFLCDKHFETSQFKQKNLLVEDAIPSIFNCQPLSDDVIDKFILSHEFYSGKILYDINNQFW